MSEEQINLKKQKKNNKKEECKSLFDNKFNEFNNTRRIRRKCR